MFLVKRVKPHNAFSEKRHRVQEITRQIKEEKQGGKIFTMGTPIAFLPGLLYCKSQPQTSLTGPNKGSSSREIINRVRVIASHDSRDTGGVRWG